MQMDARMMGHGEQIVDMGKVRSNGQVEQHIPVNSVTIEDMVMERSFTLMARNTQVNGETTRGMVKVNFHG